ncbi:MoaD/ThiS family protein [Paractinoplanes brasiliensis]|uniref:MoaD/ThiS family protein n=1 Tax=Paractinoplanes brasiliensis TaxID=52695 RepID=UPI00105CED6D
MPGGSAVGRDHPDRLSSGRGIRLSRPEAPVATLTIRYFAGARAAAGGTRSETVEAETLEHLKQQLTNRHGERLGVVLKAASFLVDGLTCHDQTAPLPADATIDVLPPFAGG